MGGTRRWTYREQLAVIALVVGGCASHGELVALREDVVHEFAKTRQQLNERVDKALVEWQTGNRVVEEQYLKSLAEVRTQLQGLVGVQGCLKDLQSHEGHSQRALDDLKQQLVNLTAAHATMKDLQQQLESLRQSQAELSTRIDAARREKARLHGLLQTVEDTLLEALKSGQTGLRGRLKTVERSVKELEHASGTMSSPSQRWPSHNAPAELAASSLPFLLCVPGW